MSFRNAGFRLLENAGFRKGGRDATEVIEDPLRINEDNGGHIG